jgi:manganese transport protein
MAKKEKHRIKDSTTIQSARNILSGKKVKNPLLRILPFLGPAFIASIAYVDPGNFATNISGGAKFGYTLLWVIFASNIIAMIIQSLAAKLGIASGHSLAENCRIHFPRGITITLWFLMELVAIATDLAEFLGAAVGFNLLLGIPLFLGGILTAIATFLILGLERFGFRPLEAVITGFVGIIAVSYLIVTILDKPDWNAVLFHAFVPQFKGSESVVLAVGILGATVMPHAIFLHSSLTQGRIVVREKKRLKKLFKYELIDVIVAMGIASFVNASMLVMAASTFFKSGQTNIGTLEQAHKTLEPLLGPAASVFFALSLLASGLSSSAVGTNAGQLIMKGFLDRHIPVWLRRGITIAPAMLVIFIGLDPTYTLVLSQVVLSFGLPFAIVPLVYFTSRKKIMGVLVNKKITTISAIIISALIIGLNIFLIVQTIMGG